MARRIIKSSLLREIIREEVKRHIIAEVKPGRAWEGKLKKIDQLLAWMYDKDILNKGEKNKKDSLFNQYYRYYNDGDMPYGLAYSPESVVKQELENRLETFLKDMLSKYLPKIDRTAFRYDAALNSLQTVKEILDDDDFYGFSTYWVKTVTDPKGKLKSLANKMNNLLSKLDKLLPKEYKNRTTSSAKRDLTKSKRWTPDMEDIFKSLQVLSAESNEIVSNMISAIEKAKKIHTINLGK